MGTGTQRAGQGRSPRHLRAGPSRRPDTAHPDLATTEPADLRSEHVGPHILRDQLFVGDDEFWACVRQKKVPQRGRSEPTTPPIPAGVVAQLLSHGVEESEVRLMSRAEAIEQLNLISSQEA